MFFHGILASLKVLVSQAHGAKNFGLAGTYVQIGIWTHHLLSLPLILIGWNNFDNIVLRLGLDEDTAESAEHYARFVLLYEAFGIYDGALHCVMDVTGHEKYSAMSNGVRAFVSFLTVLTVSAVYEGAELWMVGAIHLIVKILFVFSNVCVIFHRQWLDEYWSEVDINSLKDWPTVKALWNASLRLSSGRVIENCEWNILFVFAAIQGPAEVAIWGLVGVLWDFADDIIIAISDASKVRCAYLLGSGLPAQAKYSSEKSLLIGVAVSIIISFSLAFLQSEIPRWLTNDYTLQRLLGDMIPLLCLAIGALSFGSVCWSILCAQGRSHLATAVTGFGSLVIALPLASLSNFCFNFNLQGLIACLIIGYATSGFLNSILLLTSNWSKISQRVRRITLRSEEK
jgi:Na+-driven multidrug efflux pump